MKRYLGRTRERLLRYKNTLIEVAETARDRWNLLQVDSIVFRILLDPILSKVTWEPGILELHFEGRNFIMRGRSLKSIIETGDFEELPENDLVLSIETAVWEDGRIICQYELSVDKSFVVFYRSEEDIPYRHGIFFSDSLFGTIDFQPRLLGEKSLFLISAVEMKMKGGLKFLIFDFLRLFERVK